MKIVWAIFVASTFFVIGILTLFANSEFVAAVPCCTVDSDCYDDEDCNWPGGLDCLVLGKCERLDCQWVVYADECNSDSDCGSGKYCSFGTKSGTFGQDHSCQSLSVDECKSCPFPSADCDGGGGCEVADLNADWNNCGSCGNDCTKKAPFCDALGKEHSFPGPCDSGTCRENIACTESCCDSFHGNSDAYCDGDTCTLPQCDKDVDGFKDASNPKCSSGDDCNDDPATGAAINPGASDSNCNGIDEDCDGVADDGFVSSACGVGVCADVTECEGGIEFCSTIGTDCGTCCLCSVSANPKAQADLSQGADCAATVCPADGCNAGGCGANIWGNFPASVSNECSALFTCTSNSCSAACGPDADGDGYSPSCGDCNDGNVNIYPGSCNAAAITWSSTCAESTTGGCGSGTCPRDTDGVSCGTQDCDPSDTTCRNYNDVSIACSGGSCPGSALCSSYTDAPDTTACYNGERVCTAGDNRYCNTGSGNIYADTGTDKSCTGYCTGTGSCNSCTPAGCDTAVWSTCSDTCSGETSPTYKAADTVVNYELCVPAQTSCPSTSLNDVCTGNVLTEYYCNSNGLGGDAVAAPDVNCDIYDYECQGACGTGVDSCVARDYSCSGGGNGYCSFSTVDADTGSGWCGGGCAAQGTVWSTGGEAAAFGEYAAGVGAGPACCGDDSNEKYRSTAKGATTYSACCNAATDCVDVGNACVADGTQSGGFECVGGVWADGDVSEAQCTFASGYWNAGGEVVATPCCGDDAGENPWYRKCVSGACTDVVSDRRCCDAPTDCVFNGLCFSDVNSAAALVPTPTSCSGKPNEAACLSGAAKEYCIWTGSSCVTSRAGVQVYGSGNLSAYADVDSDGSAEVCVASSPGEWRETAGVITGTVRNVSTGDQCVAQCPAPCVLGCPVGGALVKVLGTALSATTGASGAYTVANVPSRAHDLVAAKSGYEASTVFGVFVPDGATVTVDFTLVRALGGGCEDDCTTLGSNLCDARCHGKGLCWFYSDATRAACDGTFGIIEMPGGLENVDCCKGRPYSPIKADITVPSKNVIVKKLLVLYHGKFVNMVMVVFNR